MESYGLSANPHLTGLNGAPHTLQVHIHLELVNVTLLGKRVFTDVLGYNGSGWIRVSASPVAGILVRRGKFGPRHSGERAL